MTGPTGRTGASGKNFAFLLIIVVEATVTVWTCIV